MVEIGSSFKEKMSSYKREIQWVKDLVEKETRFYIRVKRSQPVELTIEEEIKLRRKGATIINAPKDLPYKPFRSKLYNWFDQVEWVNSLLSVKITKKTSVFEFVVFIK